MSGTTRIQGNVLAKAERRFLNFLCARLPVWITPDKLTIIGFAGALLCAAGYVLSNYASGWLWLSIVSYFINWFGDSLDGSLARFRKIERPKYGYFIDHSLDSLSNFILIFSMGVSPYMRMEAALLALAAYLLISIHTFIAAKAVDEFRLSYAGGGPTELRIMLIAMTGAMLWFGPYVNAYAGFSPFDIFAVAVAAILAALFVMQTTVTGKILRAKGL